MFSATRSSVTSGFETPRTQPGWSITASSAIRVLRDEGYIAPRSTRGYFVRDELPTPPEPAPSAEFSALRTQLGRCAPERLRALHSNLDELAEKYEPEGYQKDYLYTIANYYKGSLYGYETDGDAYVMFYLKDWLDDPEQNKKFADKAIHQGQADGGKRDEQKERGIHRHRSGQPAVFLDLVGVAAVIDHAQQHKQRAGGDPVVQHLVNRAIGAHLGEGKDAQNAEAQVADRGIGNQLLHIGLHQRHQRADQCFLEDECESRGARCRRFAGRGCCDAVAGQTFSTSGRPNRPVGRKISTMIRIENAATSLYSTNGPRSRGSSNCRPPRADCGTWS